MNRFDSFVLINWINFFIGGFMKTKVTFRHVKTQPELQEAALEAAERFEKFYSGITSTDIIFKKEAENISECLKKMYKLNENRKSVLKNKINGAIKPHFYFPIKLRNV